MEGYTVLCFALVVYLGVISTNAQLPPRFNIPGAILAQPGRSSAAQRPPIPIRLRKPIGNALPISIPIREESEEESRPSLLDDEVARLSLSNIQANSKPIPLDDEPLRPLPFRPERPIPILRQDLRESAPTPLRQNIRQDFDDEPPIRQPARQAPIPQIVRQHAPVPQQVRQKPRPQPSPRPAAPQYLDDEDERRNRNRKPPVQILRKYRTDNEDGSITWGFENEDGTFKEETIGADCVIRGKYGYIDPEGTRREYSYETGNKCDKPEEEYPLEELPLQQVLHSRPGKKQYSVPLKIQN